MGVILARCRVRALGGAGQGWSFTTTITVVSKAVNKHTDAHRERDIHTQEIRSDTEGVQQIPHLSRTSASDTRETLKHTYQYYRREHAMRCQADSARALTIIRRVCLTTVHDRQLLRGITHSDICSDMHHRSSNADGNAARIARDAAAVSCH